MNKQSAQIPGIELKNSAWYKKWFDSGYYHTLYKNRDEQEASSFIENLLNWLEPIGNANMIDVGCGAGRHARQLARAGYDTIGIDLSLQSIRMAKKYENPFLRFFQHDMRKPFGKNHFDYVFNLFTSFGYFRDQTEHGQVIGNHALALKPGGRLVMDYLNASYSAAHLVPLEKKEIDGVIYDIERWTTETHFFKRIDIHDKFVGSETEYIEQVARFSIADFQKMFDAVGLKIEHVFGDYELNEFDPMQSPRMIMIARK